MCLTVCKNALALRWSKLFPSNFKVVIVLLCDNELANFTPLLSQKKLNERSKFVSVKWLLYSKVISLVKYSRPTSPKWLSATINVFKQLFFARP